MAEDVTATKHKERTQYGPAVVALMLMLYTVEYSSNEHNIWDFVLVVIISALILRADLSRVHLLVKLASSFGIGIATTVILSFVLRIVSITQQLDAPIFFRAQRTLGGVSLDFIAAAFFAAVFYLMRFAGRVSIPARAPVAMPERVKTPSLVSIAKRAEKEILAVVRDEIGGRLVSVDEQKFDRLTHSHQTTKRRGSEKDLASASVAADKVSTDSAHTAPIHTDAVRTKKDDLQTAQVRSSTLNIALNTVKNGQLRLASLKVKVSIGGRDDLPMRGLGTKKLRTAGKSMRMSI